MSKTLLIYFLLISPCELALEAPVICAHTATPRQSSAAPAFHSGRYSTILNMERRFRRSYINFPASPARKPSLLWKKPNHWFLLD